MTKHVVENGELKFTEPVDFDYIYDETIEIIIEMYPRTEDLLEALSDMTYDDVAIDFRHMFLEIAKEQGLFRATPPE